MSKQKLIALILFIVGLMVASFGHHHLAVVSQDVEAQEECGPQDAGLNNSPFEYGDDRALFTNNVCGEFWAFFGEEGDIVRISMQSGDFDPYLDLYANDSGNSGLLISDDDSGGGTNALIIFQLPYTGAYGIVARPIDFQTGNYRLSLNVDNPRPQLDEFDLGLLSMSAEVEDGELVIVGEVENNSNIDLPDIVVIPEAPNSDWQTTPYFLSLGPGQIDSFEVRLTFPETAYGDSFTIVVEVSAAQGVDVNTANNTQSISIQLPAQPIGDDDDTGSDLGIELIVALALGGLTLAIAATWLMGRNRRQAIQAKAQEGDLPPQCQPGSQAYHKAKLQPTLARYSFSQVTLHIYDQAGQQLLQNCAASGNIIHGLNEALGIYRRNRHDAEGLNRQLDHTSRTLVEELVRCIQRSQATVNVVIYAQLEGSDIEFQYTVYECVQQGNTSRWQKKREWTASVTDTRNEFVGTLNGVPPTQNPAQLANAVPTITQYFVDFIYRM